MRPPRDPCLMCGARCRCCPAACSDVRIACAAGLDRNRHQGKGVPPGCPHSIALEAGGGAATARDETSVSGYLDLAASGKVAGSAGARLRYDNR